MLPSDNIAIEVLHKEDGVFDETGALNDLIESYGQIEKAVQPSDSGKKKRKTDDGESNEAESSENTEKAKKVRAQDTVAVS